MSDGTMSKETDKTEIRREKKERDSSDKRNRSEEHFEWLMNSSDRPTEDEFEDEISWDELVQGANRDPNAFLQLSLVDGVGIRTMGRLLRRFGSATEALRATLSELGQIPRIGPKIATAIQDASSSKYAEQVIKLCNSHGIAILYPGDKRIPNLLNEIADPPLLLFTLEIGRAHV